MNNLWRLLIAVMTFGALSLSSVVYAQEGASYRVAVLFTDPDDSAKVHKALVDALGAQSNVQLVDARRVLAVSDRREVAREDYRKGSRRAKLTSTFASIMDEVGVDALVLIDMISRGRRVQAVVIGPEGNELADIRTGARAVLNSKNTMRRELLEPVLSHIQDVVELEPQSAGDETSEQESDTSTDDSDAKGDLAQQTTGAASSESLPALQPRGTEIQVGGFFGRRSFAASSASAYTLEHATPQLGAHAAARFPLENVSDENSDLHLHLEGAWAPYYVFVDVQGEARREPGRHLSGRAELVYRHRVASNIAALMAVGGDIVSDTVDPNPFFTGSRYINARALAGLSFSHAGLVEFDVSGGVMPVIVAETSGTAFGQGSRGLGYTGRAGLRVALSNNVAMHVGYDLQFYTTDFASPRVSETSIQTQEIFHGARIGFSYASLAQ